jgi:deoxyribose-phosphate aldolase
MDRRQNIVFYLRRKETIVEHLDIISKVDHTLLTKTATWSEIKKICDEGMKYHTASVCIPASYVKRAKNHVQDLVPICTVVGFPNGYTSTAAKIFEAEDALQNGADEIDMVINFGYIKDGLFDLQLEEIKAVKRVCGKKILKVIIETCLLTNKEKIKMCETVTEVRADFIKTSTGFDASGATFEDIALFTKHLGSDVKIKAAGGISTIEAAEKFISLGADRIGTSRIVQLIESLR